MGSLAEPRGHHLVASVWNMTTVKCRHGNNSNAYHLAELVIARSPGHPSHTPLSIPRNSRVVLDIGCGAGQTLIAACPDSIPLACGIDRDFDALRLGHQLAGRIHFVCALGEQLPFKSSSVDFVISRVALPYMDIPTALAEIARILNPAGGLWISLHPFSISLRQMIDSLRALNLKAVLFRMYVLINGLVFHFTARVFPLPFKNKTYESFQTPRGIRRALQRAGFRQIEIPSSNSFIITARKVRRL